MRTWISVVLLSLGGCVVSKDYRPTPTRWVQAPTPTAACPDGFGLESVEHAIVISPPVTTPPPGLVPVDIESASVLDWITTPSRNLVVHAEHDGLYLTRISSDASQQVTHDRIDAYAQESPSPWDTFTSARFVALDDDARMGLVYLRVDGIPTASATARLSRRIGAD